MKKFLMLLLALVFAVGVAAGGYYWYMSSTPTVSYRTAKVEKGDLAATISATGTLEPEEVVDVGAQVAGKILRFGRDPVANGDNATGMALGPVALGGIARDPRIPYKIASWNTPVTPNTLLAEIDPQIYQAQVDQAEAGVKNAQANIGVIQARLIQSGRDWDRAQQLAKSPGAIAPSDYDMYLANNEINKANLGVAQAQLASAQANLEQAKINLVYTKIYSPVDGIVIDRRVNTGQTVVASISAPSLFLIAKDISKMQAWGSVNEADIGQIHQGQPVTFTVDAVPNHTFTGTVGQIRLNAQMTQQVVTYTVVVDFSNADKLLMPYQTANLLFEVDKRHDALLVPNGALRWQPSPAQIAPDIKTQYLHSLQVKNAGGAPPTDTKDAQHRGVLWVQDGNFVRPVKVKTGLSDGANTEIVSVIKDKDGVFGDLEEGTVIVTGTQAKGGAESTSNPFTPQMFGGKK